MITRTPVAGDSTAEVASGLQALQRAADAQPAHPSPLPVWQRVLLPSLADCLFLALIILLFFSTPEGWSRLLLDGDTGWHIRAGEWILANGAVPKGDLFSFSKPGEPWFAWEWLADVIYAFLHGWIGLKGVVLLGGLQIALFATLLIRFMVWRGANVLIALGVGLVAVGASSMHYLARPHLFTLVLLVVSMWMVDADRRRPGRLVWLLAPLTAVWTNLHGGFLALIACLGLLAAGSAVEAWLNRPHLNWPHKEDLRRVKRYVLLTLACGAASIVNPYGIELHKHVLAYLRSDWIREAIQEFQSPRFRNENILQYEALLIVGLLAAAAYLSRRRVVEALWIIFWVHQSLGSVRHVTVYVTIAAPLIASELSRWWDRWAASGGPKSLRVILDRLAADRAPAFRRTSIWPIAIVVLLILVDKPIRWPQDFPAERFPVSMVTRHAGLLQESRVMTEDQWADYLIYRFYPRQRVYIDGRSDFYGAVLGREYLRLVNGGHDWEGAMEKNRFDAALVPAAWPLASLLKRHPGWRVLDDDGKALMFVKRDLAVSRPEEGLVPRSKTELGPNGNLPTRRISYRSSQQMKAAKPAPEAHGGRNWRVPARPQRSRREPFEANPAGAGPWTLPSGQDLIDFALNAGIVANGLMGRDHDGPGVDVAARDRHEAVEETTR